MLFSEDTGRTIRGFYVIVGIVHAVCLCSYKNWEDQTAITERVVQLLHPVEESLGCFRTAEGECLFVEHERRSDKKAQTLREGLEKKLTN